MGLNVVEFVLYVRGPCDVALANRDTSCWAASLSTLPKLEGVIEITLSDKTTRNSRLLVIKLLFSEVKLLVFPEIADLDDWVTTAELGDRLVGASQLLIVSGLDVSSVILIEVIQLIVNVNWTLNLVVDYLEVNFARNWVALGVDFAN